MNEYRVYALPGSSCDILPSELISLWVSAGWGSADRYSNEAVSRALHATDCVIAARSNSGLLVGCTRVLSDGVYYTAIADMLVHPSYRGRGIGRAMLELVQLHYAATGIFIEALPDAAEFFAACNFRRRDMVAMAKAASPLAAPVL